MRKFSLLPSDMHGGPPLPRPRMCVSTCAGTAPQLSLVSRVYTLFSCRFFFTKKDHQKIIIYYLLPSSNPATLTNNHRWMLQRTPGVCDYDLEFPPFPPP